MRTLAFSDLHTDLEQAGRLVEMSEEADLVLAAGDFASMHERLEETIAVLSKINAPTVLVPGNNETEDALRTACEGWRSATVLHGEVAELGDVTVFGLGAGIPTTPWDWSFDMSEEQAEQALGACPEGAILVLHSPPHGHCDRSGTGDSLGSEALRTAIERVRPAVSVCGHIHESWGCESEIAGSRILNLGPKGTWIEL